MDAFETVVNLKMLFESSNSQTLMIIFGLLFALLLVVYGIPRLVFYIYEKNAIPGAQELVKGLIYKLDETADELSNKEKRDKVAKLINEKAKFKDTALPMFMCGWVVDFLVRRIREEQAACKKDSNLHQ